MTTPSVVRTGMETEAHSAKQKPGHHTIYLDDYVIQRQMNNQGSMRNKLKRINIRAVNHLNNKSR
jgi:hypothetical protein